MKKLLTGILITLVMAFFMPDTAFAGVTLDATANATSNDVSAGWSHTVGASANLLIVGVTNNAGSTGYSCTFNGTAMTQVGNQRTDGSVGLAMFYLKNPATGTHTVSCSGGVGNDAGASASYNGLPANFSIDGASGCQTGGSNCSSLNVTTGWSNALIVGVWGSGSAMSAGANTNERIEDTHGGGSFDAIADMGTYPAAPNTYTITENSAGVSQAAAFGSTGGGGSVLVASMSY